MKTPKRILDRRRCLRIDETLPFQMGREGFEFESASVNISANGALCVMDHEVPVMTKLSILISIPAHAQHAKKTLKVRGVVIRRDKNSDGKYHTAIFFSEIKPGDQRTLQDFIEHRLTP